MSDTNTRWGVWRRYRSEVRGNWNRSAWPDSTMHDDVFNSPQEAETFKDRKHELHGDVFEYTVRPYPAPTPPQQSPEVQRFKVGDRVQWKNVGAGTVESIRVETGFMTVQWDNGGAMTSRMDAAYISPLPTPPESQPERKWGVLRMGPDVGFGAKFWMDNRGDMTAEEATGLLERCLRTACKGESFSVCVYEPLPTPPATVEGEYHIGALRRYDDMHSVSVHDDAGIAAVFYSHTDEKQSLARAKQFLDANTLAAENKRLREALQTVADWSDDEDGVHRFARNALAGGAS